MKRYAMAILLLLISSALFACHYMEVLVVDTPKYTISGVVREAQDVEDLLDKASAKGITYVHVAIRCPGTEKAVTQNRAGPLTKTASMNSKDIGISTDAVLFLSTKITSRRRL
jgi:hypothetical protein